MDADGSLNLSQIEEISSSTACMISGTGGGASSASPTKPSTAHSPNVRSGGDDSTAGVEDFSLAGVESLILDASAIHTTNDDDDEQAKHHHTTTVSAVPVAIDNSDLNLSVDASVSRARGGDNNENAGEEASTAEINNNASFVPTMVPNNSMFVATANVLPNLDTNFNPKKKDKYIVKDDYEDHADGIMTMPSSAAGPAADDETEGVANNGETADAAAQVAPVTTGNAQQQQAVASSSSSSHQQQQQQMNNGSGIVGGLKSQLATSGAGGTGIHIVASPEEGKIVRHGSKPPHFSSPTGAVDYDNNRNASFGSQRDTNVIVTDQQQRRTNTIGPNSDVAQPQLLSLNNPDSLLGDYISLPEDAIPPLTFRVVKQHHRMGWLKQSRLIVVTGCDLRNCKEGEKKKEKEKEKERDRAMSANAASSPNNNSNSTGGGYANIAMPDIAVDASATKIIPFSSITRLSLTSKTSFAVHVLGDHTYYYISDHSLEIVWAIRKRMSICAAIAKLVRGTTAGTQQLRELARAFMCDDLTLPQFSAGADFMTTGGGGGDSNGGGASSSPSEKVLREQKEKRSQSGIDSVFSTDKAAAEALRYATNMKNRMAIIDALKNDILPEEGRAIRELIDVCCNTKGGVSGGVDSIAEFISLKRIRNTMDEIRETISEKIIDMDMRETKQQVKYLPEIYDVSIARAVSDEAIQTVLLTAAHGNIWAALHLQSDLVGLDSKFRQQCRFLRTEVSPQELGVPEKCLDFHYDLVLESIRRIATAKTPHVMLEEITACCKSIVLTISAGTQFGFTRADIPNAKFPSASDDTSAADGEKNGEEEKKKKKKTETLAADDILPILIFLIIHSSVYDLVYVREYINELGDPEEASERSYYYTMFSSAIEYVLASAEEVKRMREYNARQKEKEVRRKEREIQRNANTNAPTADGASAPRRGVGAESCIGSGGAAHNNDGSASSAEKKRIVGDDNGASAASAADTNNNKPSSLADIPYVSEDDEEAIREEAEIAAKHAADDAEAEAAARAAEEKRHLLLSRGGSIGRYKQAPQGTEGFANGKVVPDDTTTSLSETVARLQREDEERERELQQLQRAVEGGIIAAAPDADLAAPSTTSGRLYEGDEMISVQKKPRTSSKPPPIDAFLHSENTMAFEDQPTIVPEYADPNDLLLSVAAIGSPSGSVVGAPTSTTSTTATAGNGFVFLSPFSAFVQSDVTLNYKKQALIRHQNSTNYNKKATSASSPYSIQNLLKNNPMNLNLGGGGNNRSSYNGGGASVASPSGVSVASPTATIESHFQNAAASPTLTSGQQQQQPHHDGSNDPYYLQRPRGMTTPSQNAAEMVTGNSFALGSEGLASAYRYV